jgi:hypothetical protein
MKVKELTVEEFKSLIQEAIEEKLEEIIGDPDLGLELREEIKERLRSSLAAMQGGEKGIPIEEAGLCPPRSTPGGDKLRHYS